MRWVVFLLPLVAHAQEIPLEGADAELALAMARVTANEASLGARVVDAALTWQVTRSHGDTSEERLAWLRQHSSCVLGDQPLTRRQRRTNCVWTRNLADSDAQPEGWRDRYGPWDAHAPRWARLRRQMRIFVAGRSHIRMPCRETPWTWGSRSLDMDHALAIGLRPLGCVGPVNEGFGLPLRENLASRE
jgi:hypothetical protein